LGRRGGLARARRLSETQKRRIAASGAQARLRSLEAERRIVANFRYAAAVAALQRRHSAPKRVDVFSGRLPGVYRQSK
jgi:hypothetical protein